LKFTGKALYFQKKKGNDKMPLWREYVFDKCESTNDTAKQYPPFSGVQAKMQTKGRGRLGRVWTSKKGNLFVSYVFPAVKRPSDMSFVAACGVALALQDYAPCLKWPNDVLIDGEKVCGILIETAFLGTQPEKTIVGIGINIDSHPDNSELLYKTTCLNKKGKKQTPETIKKRLTQALDSVFSLYQQKGFEAIRQKWLSWAPAVGHPFKVRLSDKTEEGLFLGINENGSLMLALDNKEIRVISAGDVFIK
jgi:BirA family transcriptional regulator, biotin operon repressor / biotin---[acetyl-CoA-carboxylase] ligase